MTSAETTSLRIESSSPAATEALAAALGRACRGGEVILLSGPLGAGKTRFVRGLIAGLDGDPRRVKSPTFGVLHRYPAGARTLDHFDAYFVRDPDEFARTGLDEFIAAGDVVAVEWPERVRGAFPPDVLSVEIAIAGEEARVLAVTAAGFRAREALGRFVASGVSP